MERRVLGSTGHEISVLGFGAWEIGGPGGGFAWSAQPDGISIAAIHDALESGVNWIDTAPAYGLGHSEEVVGRAVRALAEPPLVFTKCSLVWDERGEVWSDLRPESIRREAAASLRRLGVEAIDLYQIHWPYPDGQLEEAWETLVALRDEGLVRAIGASNLDAQQLRRLVARSLVGALQPPYSVLRREIEAKILPYCLAEGIGVIAYSPLASGLLSGTMTRERMAALPPNDWRHSDRMFAEPYLAQHLKVVELLRSVGAQYGATPAEVAIAWVLSRPGITAAILGMSRSDQVPVAARASALVLDEADMTRIEAGAASILTLPPPPDRFTPRTSEEVDRVVERSTQ